MQSMHELMFQAGVKGMSERSELPSNVYISNIRLLWSLALKLQTKPNVHISICTKVPLFIHLGSE